MQKAHSARSEHCSAAPDLGVAGQDSCGPALEGTPGRVMSLNRRVARQDAPCAGLGVEDERACVLSTNLVQRNAEFE